MTHPQSLSLCTIKRNGLHQENVSVAWKYINILRKQKADERAGWWLSTVVRRLHSGLSPAVGSEAHDGSHRDSLHTIAPMFTADNLVSFQQLWGKLNLRKCSFSCPLDRTITLSPKVHKNICLQRTVQKININWLSGYVRTKQIKLKQSHFFLFCFSFGVTARKMKVCF